MELTKTIQEFQTLQNEIRNKKLYLYLSYPLTLLYVGIPLRKWTNNKLEKLTTKQNTLHEKLKLEIENAENQTKIQINELEKQDTYLITTNKNEITTQLEENLKNLQYLQTKQDLFNAPFNQNVTNTTHEIQHALQKINTYNIEFINNRKKQYTNLWKQSTANLDDDQLTAIITDDKHNLVVAGAGSGKTEVLITRIAYLTKRKDTIKPERILALAFQNKAANEITERLKKRYNTTIEAKTFHSLGKEILDVNAKQTQTKTPQLKFGDNYEKEYKTCIKQIYESQLKNETFQNKIIKYIENYDDTENEKTPTDFQTKQEYTTYMEAQRYTALDGTKVKSQGEKTILNYFITHQLNNTKINIQYEQPADWMTYTKEDGNERTPNPDFTFPDFNLYLEHWALDENGQVPNWFKGQEPTKNNPKRLTATEKYTQGMELKKAKFEKQNTYHLIETYYYESKETNFINTLEKRFLKAIQKQQPKTTFTINSVPYNELINQIWEEARESINSIPKQISEFITIAKTYNLTPNDIRHRLEKEKWTQKQKTFTDIALQIYQEYENLLRAENKIDFADMINQSINALNNNPKLYTNIYDHILIDEYQDISTQRYQLIKTLMTKNQNCKLFCVGDDWQSIMAFTGANLNYFTNFHEHFEFPTQTHLTTNYRSAKPIVDTGAQLIRVNGKTQIQKATHAHNPTHIPVTIHTGMHTNEINYYTQMTLKILQKIKQLHAEGYGYNEFMILYRAYNFKLHKILNEQAQKLEIPLNTNTNNCVRVSTIHSSKGLQAKIVFILDVTKGLNGFPSEKEDLDILQIAMQNKNIQKDHEERRLFYVAITRAQQQLHIYTQNQKQSKYIKEIQHPTNTQHINY